jgi:hypothetical protein
MELIPEVEDEEVKRRHQQVLAFLQLRLYRSLILSNKIS